MKTSLLSGIIFCVGLNLFGQASSSSAPATQAQDSSYKVIDRDANSRVIERTTYERGPSGKLLPHVRRYTELATGMHYKDQKTGEWVESKEQVNINANGGGQAIQGQHQVYFPYDIYGGVIEVVTPDGKHLKSRPVAVSYYDGTNSVLIGELKHSIGQILPSGNQVIYTNAFTDFAADIVATYKRSGFECDLVFREQPLAPEAFGLKSENCQIGLLTEFFDTDDPKQHVSKTRKTNGFEDAEMSFGNMTMVHGKAFETGVENNTRSKVVSQRTGIPVKKTWTRLQGRKFLIEEVPATKINSKLRELPAASSASMVLKDSDLHKVTNYRALPQRHSVASVATGITLARQDVASKPGVVLDYLTLNSSTNDFTFQGDTTYLISGTFSVLGTTTFEGGTVIKFDQSSTGFLDLEGPWNFQTGPYRMAVFTSKDDDSVGDTIDGSTGTPTVTTLQYIYADNYQGILLKYASFRYAGLGIYANYDEQGGGGVWDCQFLHCAVGLTGEDYTDAYLRNVLFSDCAIAIAEASIPEVLGTLRAENVTADHVGTFYDAPYNLGYLTNSILTTVTNMGTFFFFGHCLNTNSSSGVYESVGGGNYYLSAGSTNRDRGATNINPALLAELSRKTTFSPIVFSNADFSGDIELKPQAKRDSDVPDLGYHYDPIDYAFGNTLFEGSMTSVRPGTVIGAFGTEDGDFGLRVNGGGIICKGLVTNWNHIVAYNTVQERARSGWKSPAGGVVFFRSGSSADFRFTDFSVLAQEAQHLSGSPEPATFRDCQFHSGGINLDYSGPGGGGSSITPSNCGVVVVSDPAINNCLFERVNTVLINEDVISFIQNNLFWRGTFNFSAISGTATVQNNLFDKTIIPDNSSVSIAYSGGYNAFITNCDLLIPYSGHDLILTNELTYSVGPLGNYYQPSGNPLINAGATTADQLGLYDYTVQTNLASSQEIKETNSTVDIGYHYVAVDTDGIPISTYTNSLPDYLVTSSTSDIADWWEFENFGNLDHATNSDFDSDGTNILAEYQNGIDPNKVTFSFSVPNQYVTTNIIEGIVTVLGGVPSTIAVLVDTTNFATATWVPYTSSNVTVNITTNQGPHDIWIGMRGRLDTSYQTWVETTLVLNSLAPTITITSPAANVSLNSSRVNVHGNFSSGAFKQIIVNGIIAFVNDTNFDALNFPLAGGTNVIVATVEDITGATNTASIFVIGTTNADGSMNNPVQLQPTPVAGFAPLQVTFSILTNLAGTVQQVLYDFNGDDVIDFVTNNLSSVTYTYGTNGEYFPVVTIQTTAGWFSSVGGWNPIESDPTNLPIRINVQPPPTVISTISVTDPVDIKWVAPSNLYVLSGSTATLTQFSSNGDTIRSVSGIGTSPSGFDVDNAGNVYVAVTASNQVWKFFPTNSSFQADTNFGVGGCIGLTNGSSGTDTNQFNSVFDVAVSHDGSQIVVSDSGNNRIQEFSATNGAFIASFGSVGGDIGQFSSPKGLTYDGLGYLYIADSGNDRVALATSSSVVGVSGTNGSALGQFNAPIHISAGERAIYVADAGNNRIQSFNLLANGVYSFSSSDIRFALSTNLSGPASVAAVDNLTNEIFYVADTGNNRVLLYSLAGEDPTPSWNNFTNHISSGDISGAISTFSSTSIEGYRQAFLDIGTADLAADISQIGPLTPVFIEGDTAEYSFEQTIDDQLLLFTVEFVKENGVWKILEF